MEEKAKIVGKIESTNELKFDNNASQMLWIDQDPVFPVEIIFPMDQVATLARFLTELFNSDIISFNLTDKQIKHLSQFAKITKKEK